MRITRLFFMLPFMASMVFTLSCTTDPGSVEAMNSASWDQRNIIGIEITNLTTSHRTVANYGGDGVYVSAVISGHPASLAGVQVGDIILSVNSIPVSTVSDALEVINNLEGGRKYPFRVYRPLGKPNLKNIIAYVLIERIQERAIGRIS